MQLNSGRPMSGSGGENKCSLCSTKFNAVNRKRTCRVCRGIFCTTCSNYRLSIPRFGYTKPVRACVNCHIRFLLVREEIDFTYLFEDRKKKGGESASAIGSSSSSLRPRKSVDGSDDEEEESNSRRGSEDSSSKRSGSKRLLRSPLSSVKKNKDSAEPPQPGSAISTLTSSGGGSSSSIATGSSFMEFDLREKDVREAIKKLKLPVLLIDRRCIEVVQRKTVVFTAGAPILVPNRLSSSGPGGPQLKLAEVNMAFFIISGHEMTSNMHKRASIRKQRGVKGAKYAVILDGQPFSDERGPDRAELSVVFKNLYLFDWLSFSRAIRELITLSTLNKGAPPAGGKTLQNVLAEEMAPYFIQMVGVTVTDGSNGLQIGFVFEPMTKGSLRNCLIQRPEEFLDAERVFNIVRHIAVAMTHLHDTFGYIHANLSPENILVADDWSVKVGGFGNAVKPEGIPYVARSSPSPRFHLAPEVLRRGEYSFASDVYSYGMILVELTTLQPPFKQEQFKQLRKVTDYAEIGEAIESYGLLPVFNQSNEIGGLICQCLAIDPKSRPKFTEIVKRLDEIKDEFIAELQHTSSRRASQLIARPAKSAKQQPSPPSSSERTEPTPDKQSTVKFADDIESSRSETEGEPRKSLGDSDDDEEEQENALNDQDLELAKEEELRRQQQREQEMKERAENEAREEEERKKKAEEERERKEQELRAEEEKKQRAIAEAEEQEKELMRERIRQMMPTHDSSKRRTMAKVEQLKERMSSTGLQPISLSQPPPEIAQAGDSTESPEERQRREKEERARRVRELAEKRRITSKPSTPVSPYDTPKHQPLKQEVQGSSTDRIAPVESPKREEEPSRSAPLTEPKETPAVDAKPPVQTESSLTPEEYKQREKEERMLKVKQIEERMKLRKSSYSSQGSPNSSKPSSRPISTSDARPVVLSSPGEVTPPQAAGDELEENFERQRGLSITELPERNTRKHLLKAGRDKQHEIEDVRRPDAVDLEIVDEVTRLLNELKEQDPEFDHSS